MSNWTLSQILAGLHDDIQSRLDIVRRTFNHPGTKGDAREKVWLELLQTYLLRGFQQDQVFAILGNLS